MIIRKLEVQGFKSFAERTKVVFHQGITAIVGPNGTGKSNLVDAMLWAIGGHRVKSVRGDRTEDVIFNGNAKRPALGMADVSLVLGDGENEMGIAHRVFRSGESEYRLNGKVVRLKDVQDELWKHQIGEREYFVIEQGAIGTFVTSKPTEKRLFLEEAAGTAYYKDKKRQAQSKLESTEQNLVRLEDIILEVEKSRNSLQRQAQAANRYRRIRERIRELTSAHYRRRLRTLEAAQRDAAALHASALDAEKAAAARVRDGEGGIASRRHALWDLEKSLEEGRNRLFALRDRVARTEAEAESESRRIDFFTERRKRAESDRGELLEEILALTRAVDEAESGRGDIERERAAREEDLRAAAAAVEPGRARRAEIEGRLEEARRARLDAVQGLTSRRNERIEIGKEHELLTRQLAKAASQAEEQDAIAARADGRSAALRDAVESLIRSREEIETRLARLREDSAAAGAACSALESRLREATGRRDEAAHHLQALRKIEAQERGGASPEFPGGRGLLADLVRTSPEDAPLFDVFWKDESRARVVPAREFLAGYRAEFRGDFLLTECEGVRVRPEIAGDPDVVGFLKSRLDAGHALGAGLTSLEDAAIVRDVPAAVRLWIAHPDGNYVTTGGDLLLSSGLLRLGPRGEGMIALVQEIRRLEAAVAAAEREAEPLAASLREMAAKRRDLHEEIEAETARLADHDRGLHEARTEAGFAEAERDKARATADVLARERAFLVSSADSLSARLVALESEIASLETDDGSLRGRVEAVERELSEAREAEAADERRRLEVQAALDVLAERVSAIDERAGDLRRRKDAAGAKINQIDAVRAEDERSAADVAEQVRILRDQARDLEAERARCAESLEASGEGLGRVRAELEEAENALQAVRAEEEAAKDARMKHEIRKAEVDRDLVNLEESCWSEIKKTLAELRAEMESEEAAAATAPEGAEAAAPAEAPEEDEAASDEDEAEEEEPAAEAAAPGLFEGAAAAAPAPRARRSTTKWRPMAGMTDADVEAELSDLREALNRFRAVNLMAEEEFREAKTRHEFLTGQRKDLRDSITQTQEAIRKIDEESQSQFLKAVEEVNRSFGEIFGLLFKGGNAEVKLLEPDNPLESGVEIVAQPPGKRVQNLALLSGGEKSLTSMAFMFALFRYRPSPFCFLDEVDAALDDVNLTRFLDLMRAIKTQTQFIIITHNFKTMEVADYIYGTTMEEPNISKLYSVRLEKKDGGENGAPAPA